MMGGGPAGSSGSGGGSTANVYTPKAQSDFDTYFQNFVKNTVNTPGYYGVGTNPPTDLYPKALGMAEQYLVPGTSQFDNAAAQATGSAQQAYNDYRSDVYPQLQGAYSSLGNLGHRAGQMSIPLPGYEQQIANEAFDPRQQVYNANRGRAMDTAQASNAAAGLGSSPYGASLAANAGNDFQMKWANQQLGREAEGAQGIGSLANSLGTLGSAQANAYNTLGNLGKNAGGTLAGFGSLPYQTGAGIGQSGLGAYGNLSNLGLSSYTLPQQITNDIQSYLGLGQSASGISGTLGNLGFNQTAQGLGGALSGANALLGNNSLLGGSSGVFGSGGLFGGAGAGLDNLAGAAALPGFDTLGGTVGMGALGGDFGGGGAAMLPMAASI